MRARVRVAPHRDARHESDAGRDLACSAAPRRCRCSCLRLRSSLSGRRSKRTAPPAAAASRCGSAAACSSSASGSLTRMTSKRSSGGSCCTCMDLDVVRWGLVHPPELQTKANKGLASALSAPAIEMLRSPPAGANKGPMPPCMAQLIIRAFGRCRCCQRLSCHRCAGPAGRCARSHPSRAPCDAVLVVIGEA
jgi:hypothetical protein